MTFSIEPIWSWPVVVLVAIALVGLVLGTYPSRVRHLPVGRRRLLLGLRLTAAALLVFAALQPVLRYPADDEEQPVLVVLADASKSMGTPDGPGGTTRREALLATLAEHDDTFDALADDVEILRFDYGDELRAIVDDETFTPEAEGARTAIGTALDRLADEIRGRPVIGVVLMGDGAQRAAPPDDADPRDVAERDYATNDVPIYTIGYGGSGIGENTLDLAVDEIQSEPVAFVKTVVPVAVRLRALGAAGRELRVRLLVEDRTGKRFGESGEMKPAGSSRSAVPVTTIVPASNDETLSVELSFVPDRVGEMKIGVEVESLDGELKQANNARETILTVRRGGIRVAYFDRLRPEMHYIRRREQEAGQVQLEFRLVRFAPNVTKIEDEFFEPGAYDVYIVGDVPAEAFGERNLRNLADRVRDGAGLLMTGGFHTFGPGGYGGTALERLLPVRIEGRVQRLDGEIDESNHRLQPLRMVPTRRGLQNYVMQLDVPSANEDHWRELAPMQGANLLQPAYEAVEVLAETPDGTPLLFLHEVPSRVMAFAADTTYQWVLHGSKDDHERFWRQMILFLARKELEGDQLVWARVDPRNFAPRQRVELEFGARDDEGRAIEAAFDVEVQGPDGTEYEPRARKRADGDVADFLDTAEPGDYWVTVRATVDGELHGGGASTRFIVDERDLELDNPAADHGLLREISETTGGSYVLPEELGSQLTRLLEEGIIARNAVNPPITLPLWDRWWFLLLFVAILSLEWLFRKRRGLV